MRLLSFFLCRDTQNPSRDTESPAPTIRCDLLSSSARSSAILILPGRSSIEIYLQAPQRAFITSKEHEGYNPVAPMSLEENSFNRTAPLEPLPS